MVAGIAVTRAGLVPATYGYGVVVIALVAAAAIASLPHHRVSRQHPAPRQQPELPPCPGTVAVPAHTLYHATAPEPR